MAESLQDQLKKLGLAREQGEGKQKSANKPRGKPAGKSHAAVKPGRGREMPLDEAWALRNRAEQKQADEARRRKQAEDRRRQRINGEIRQIVEAQRQNRDDADVPRNFLYKGRIRKVYVTAGQQQALSEGRLGIAYLTGGYHLLETAALDQVRAISPEHVVDLAGGPTGGDEDEHPVPDDLIW